MREVSNQDLEQFYFEQFRLCIDLPDGKVIYGDRPDVVISGSRTVGIEIANLYLADGSSDASEQRQRLKREAVVKKAQRIHEARGGRKIELSVDFDPKFLISDIPIVVDKLVAVAREVDEKNMIGSLSPSQLVTCANNKFAELHWIYLSGEEYVKTRWWVVHSSDVPKLSAARVREVIEKKRVKVRGYQPCDAFWLLLVVDLWILHRIKNWFGHLVSALKTHPLKESFFSSLNLSKFLHCRAVRWHRYRANPYHYAAVSAGVMQRFRDTGNGWQTRVDAALKDWLTSLQPTNG